MHEARVEMRRADGVCYVCANRPSWEPGAMCVECREQSRASSARYRAARPPKVEVKATAFEDRNAELREYTASDLN